jgi:ABC-type long-subunit fatty acid transport system fused permease/ATPase subunit
MLASLKEITLGIVFALCLYMVFGGYIVAMFNGKLPFMQHNEPKRMCAVFQDGTKYGRDSVKSIDAYHEKTGQSFEMVECK